MKGLPKIKVREIPFQQKLARRTIAQLEGQRVAFGLTLGDNYSAGEAATRAGYTDDEDIEWFINGFLSVTENFRVKTDASNRIVSLQLRRKVCREQVS